jgi:phenylalanyl-tRNA synthetase beta chain
MDLSELDSTPGTPLAKALDIDDIVVEVSVTPNRADCFSVRGLARDLAAGGAGKLRPLPDLDVNVSNDIDYRDVVIDTADCKYFSYRIMHNIDAVLTPAIVASRLPLIGQKLILGPVDIANYVCIDIGQPLHMFDLDKLPNKLFVKNATGNEKLQTLNNEETVIAEGAILISTAEKPLSIAGIMGGTDSACSTATKNILIEGAYFDKVAIARAGQKMRLLSDSRTRFERGVDPNAVNVGVDLAVSLILSRSPASVVSETKKFGKLPDNSNEIVVTFERFKNLTLFSKKEWAKAREILEKLEIKVLEFGDFSTNSPKEALSIEVEECNSDFIRVKTPSHRHDLEIQEDIIEEVLRIIGFNNIVGEKLEQRSPIIKRYTEDVVSNILTSSGVFEIKTFSFIHKDMALLFEKEDNLVFIERPQTVDFSTMRPSLVGCHLRALKNNQAKSQKNNKFFEIGRVFKQKDKEIIERNVITATFSEKLHNRSWLRSQEDVSIFDVKELLEKILNTIGTKAYKISTEQIPEYYHPGRKGAFTIHNGELLAFFGEIHPSIVADLNINGPIVCFELFLDKLPKTLSSAKKNPVELSPYQPVTRDFSFVLSKSTKAVDIVSSIEKLKIKEITSINVFDIYETETFGADKKALSFEVTMQSSKNTLSDEQIKEISDKIIHTITKQLGGVLRDS